MKMVTPSILFLALLSCSTLYAESTIPLYADTTLCMQKKSVDPAANGDNVHLWSCQNGKQENMKWNKLISPYEGYYQIELGETGYCLSKKGTDTPSNGDNVHLWSCTGVKYSNSLWKISEMTLTLYGSNQCAQKEGSKLPKNGSNVHLWNCDDGANINKQWYLDLDL